MYCVMSLATVIVLLQLNNPNSKKEEKMTTQEKTTFEITNGCTCEVINSTSVGYEPSYECFGCFDEDKASLDEIVIQPWLKANGIEDGDLIRIDGMNMNWNHTSGYGFIEASIENIIDALSINSEFILRFTLDGKNLSVSRSSHDELGALFMFSIATQAEIEEMNSY